MQYFCVLEQRYGSVPAFGMFKNHSLHDHRCWCLLIPYMGCKNITVRVCTENWLWERTKSPCCTLESNQRVQRFYGLSGYPACTLKYFRQHLRGKNPPVPPQHRTASYSVGLKTDPADAEWPYDPEWQWRGSDMTWTTWVISTLSWPSGIVGLTTL